MKRTHEHVISVLLLSFALGLIFGYVKFAHASVQHQYLFDTDGSDNVGALTLSAVGAASVGDTGTGCNAMIAPSMNDLYSNDSAGWSATPTELSVSVWVYPTELPTDTVAGAIYWNDVTHGASAQIYIENDTGNNYVKFRMFDPGNTGHTAIAGGALSLNEWHLLTLTWDGSTITGYIDGVSSATLSFSDLGNNDGGNQSHVGSRGVNNNIVGYEKDARVYDNALSSGDVLALFEAGNGCSSPTPPPPSTSTSTESTVGEAEQNLANATYIFLASMMIMLWIMRKK